jgi:hypothetical protein
MSSHAVSRMRDTDLFKAHGELGRCYGSSRARNSKGYKIETMIQKYVSFMEQLLYFVSKKDFIVIENYLEISICYPF